MSHSKLLKEGRLKASISLSLLKEYRDKAVSPVVKEGSYYCTLYMSFHFVGGQFSVLPAEEYLQGSQNLSYTGPIAMFRAI